jgi:hypothetical protein
MIRSTMIRSAMIRSAMIRWQARRAIRPESAAVARWRLTTIGSSDILKLHRLIRPPNWTGLCAAVAPAVPEFHPVPESHRSLGPSRRPRHYRLRRADSRPNQQPSCGFAFTVCAVVPLSAQRSASFQARKCSAPACTGFAERPYQLNDMVSARLNATPLAICMGGTTELPRSQLTPQMWRSPCQPAWKVFPCWLDSAVCAMSTSFMMGTHDSQHPAGCTEHF